MAVCAVDLMIRECSGWARLRLISAECALVVCGGVTGGEGVGRGVVKVLERWMGRGALTHRDGIWG